jgi:hypothetical protein
MSVQSRNTRRERRLSDRVGSAKARLLQAGIFLPVWKPVRRKKMLFAQPLRLF